MPIHETRRLIPVFETARQGEIVIPNSGSLTFGRSEECDVCIRDASMSKMHFQIICDSHSLEVVDKGSKNGTYVNQVRVKEILLMHDDVISAGSTSLRVFAPSRILTDQQIDVLASEFEAKWHPSQPSNFEDCLGKVDSNCRPSLQHELLEVEIELRRNAGEEIAPAKYEFLGNLAPKQVKRIMTMSS